MKYFLPPIKSKPFYFLDRGSDTFVICEGPFDSIAIDLVFNNPNVIGVMGSTMTNAQINSFRDLLPENIVIWLDDTSLSEKLKLKLKARIPYADFKVIESSGDDPEELLIDKLK
jgi:5S rRNA maturation endonuclease (ribonuclease M5)